MIESFVEGKFVYLFNVLDSGYNFILVCKMPTYSCYMDDIFDRTKNCLNVQDSFNTNKSLVETKKNV